MTQTSPSVSQRVTLSFTGTGSEYFRIWIVNLLLTLLTLGIYSAWGKVRRLRYFYDNTRLDGVGFEYHGRASAIFKGRVIAAVLFVVYVSSKQVGATFHLVVSLLFLLSIPWILWKSLRFRLHNSSYRGVRFAFAGRLGDAYTAWLWRPLLAGITLYLLWPFAHQRMKAYQHAGARYGRSQFGFDARVADFYRVYLLGLALAVAGVAVTLTLFAGSALASMLAGDGLGRHAPQVFLMLGGFVLLFLSTLWPLFNGMLQRCIWNGTLLDGQRFSSDLRWGRLSWITFTNLLGVLCTFGLFVPFARVRLVRYQISTLSLLAEGGLDRFEAAPGAGEGAMGDALADVFDVDFTL